MVGEALRGAAAGSLLEPDDLALSLDVSSFLQSLTDRYVLSTEWSSHDLLYIFTIMFPQYTNIYTSKQI